MEFEEAYYYFVVTQNRKKHPTAQVDPCNLGVFEVEWEMFFIPKKYIETPEGKECLWGLESKLYYKLIQN